jgi:hypothetical protein
MNKPVKIILGILVALILGSGIGIGSAVLAYESVGQSHLKNGAWSTDLAKGSDKDDAYSRTHAAVHALLGLTQAEVIYYVAATDDSGKPLSGDGVYRVEGKAPEARWWSITAYGSDDYLIPNEYNRYSYSGNNVTYDSNGKFTFYISKAQKPGAWLPTGDQKKFILELRLYNPGDSVRMNPGTVELPHIIREETK